MEKRKSRLIMASNRLPIQLTELDNTLVMRESDGGLVSALKSYFDKMEDEAAFNERVWIGAADFPESRWKKYQRKTSAKTSFSLEPLFIEKSIYSKYYNGFCNATLWPLFHYFPSYVEFSQTTYQSYEAVNQLFAEKLLEILKPGDTLWIHDYQLMLLPGMIREKMKDVSIGFFLHIPFPTYDVFRMLYRPWKEKIIQSLLSADLIGFHTTEYVQHFLKTVRMVAGVDHTYRTLQFEDRTIRVEQFPIGIDFEKFYTANDPDVQMHRDSIVTNFAGKKIIFSVDRLDYTKGITHRLSGFERFLELNPEWREKVVFILVVVPSRQIVSKYNERRKLIEEQVGSINGKYSTLPWQPIIYRYNSVDFSELSALYKTAHVALITPLRDGMNLVAKEFVASRQNQDGVLILSELAGASSELGEALLVNPVDREEVARSLAQALAMTIEDQRQSMKRMQKQLSEFDVVHWVDDFFKQLHEIKGLQKSRENHYVTNEIETQIADDFEKAERRVLFLDYDGTLVPFAQNPQLAIPDSNLLNLLREIKADEKTEVVIISGRNQAILESWFKDINLTLVAEHGASVKLSGLDWTHKNKDETDWKAIVRQTLQLFVSRSPGSMLEEKNFSLAWHYRGVDPDLGFVRSREMLDNLYHLIRNSHLNVIDGNKVIEVREAGIDKGSAALKVLETFQADYVLAIGDDKTDEDMFKALHHKGTTVKVGLGATQAHYNLRNQHAVLPFLKRLISNDK
ncbi:MAG TPA: bifunctional alpha,alpha-trehalose-phosphate synthase (UDP-forming)/trehalose-phosphatase [Chryseolinea sp.]|nr:bifunctional alpha,alpha-trehalose-phosphate synthase (UDP-forming)/trehalose-phosphatase [Chryseolinea sp.]